MDTKLDLCDLDVRKGAEAGFELQLAHPQSGTPLPIFITVLGADSDLYQTALRTQQRRRMERLARGKRTPITPEEIEEDALALLAGITTAWRTAPGVTLDGQAFPAFSQNAAKQIYQRFPWIREQVDQAMGDRANFLPRSAAN
jgi:hypothetical protein